MAYKVLSLKWRPRVFKDIVGQDHITKTLVNAFKKNRVAQGYIFTGPRGVGKTTTARILSMALNADGGPNYNYDPDSNTSVEISQGIAIDVIEIDGASNRGIEEIRNLRELIKFAPMNGQYKVIIIDEVHMLTNPAFNALLRTLEEPPEHGKFIFCTTDIHKVPATIISRCQRFDFNRIATETIIDRISFILEKEKIKIDKNSLQIIARKADGSMRDALSILDQVISFCGSDIHYEQTVSALGIIPHDLFFNYTEAVKNKDGKRMLNVLEQFSQYGVPASEVSNGIGIHLKNLLYSKIKGGNEFLDMNEENKKQYLVHAKDWDNRDLLRVSQIISEVSSHINRSNDPYLLMEVTSLKLLEMEKSVSLDKLLHSKDFFKDNDDRRKKSNFENHANDLNSDKNNVKLSNKESKAESSLKERKKNIQNKKIENENNQEENKNKVDPFKSITIVEIKDNWRNFIDKLHIKKPSIASILDNSVPVNFENGKITIQTANSLDFHLNMLYKNSDLIKNILNDEFKIELDFIIGKKYEKHIDEDKDQDNIDGLNIQNDNQLRDKIVDLFDGEILT